jgi:hypothetical protein
MTDEKNRRERELILARRRFFVASALAGVVTTACTPQPCLNVAEPPRPEEGGTPEEATGGSAGTTGAAGAPGSTESDAGTDPVGTKDPTPPDAGTIPPKVCLKVAPPPPHVCLEFAEPPEKKTK